MAPRKKTEEKPAGKAGANLDAADAVLQYLRKENRPYSAIDISANLHNKVTKAATAKILKDLHERNEIEGRAAGKQIVYHALQNPEDSCTPEQLVALDTTITNLRTSTSDLQAIAKALRSTLSSLNSTLRTADLISSMQTLEAEKAEVVGRLENLKAGKAKKVTKKERDEVEGGWKKWNGTAKKRERISKEMWTVIADAIDNQEKEAEIRESLGLDE